MITSIDKFPPFNHVINPYDHQRRLFEETRAKRYYGFFWEMGTGKTKPVIDTIQWLFLQGEIDGALIVSDKGCYMNWALEEIPKHLMPGIPHRIGAWSSLMTNKQYRHTWDMLTAQDDVLDIGLINIEALSGERGTEWARDFVRSHYTIMVIDESTSIKNPKAKRTVHARMLGQMCEYRRIMTGTPITQGPLDIFAQCEFLQPGALGVTSFTAFKGRYAWIEMMKAGTRWYPKLMGYRNLEELERIVAKFSSRLTKAECLDLPEKIYEMYFLDMTTEQRRLYEKFRDEALVQIDEGLLTSTSALTTAEKLHQILCGHVKDDDGRVIDIPHNRVSSLMELLDNTTDKVIIWCAYQRDVEQIMEALSHRTDGFGVDYYGKTSADARINNIRHFVDNPKCKWFVGTAATGGKSITLTVSATTIYYSNTYNCEDRLQSEDRNHRIGQKRPVTYIDMAIPKTVDAKVIRALRQKRDLAREILDVNRLREMIEEPVDDLEM